MKKITKMILEEMISDIDNFDMEVESETKENKIKESIKALGELFETDLPDAFKLSEISEIDFNIVNEYASVAELKNIKGGIESLKKSIIHTLRKIQFSIDKEIRAKELIEEINKFGV